MSKMFVKVSSSLEKVSLRNGCEGSTIPKNYGTTNCSLKMKDGLCNLSKCCNEKGFIKLNYFFGLYRVLLKV